MNADWTGTRQATHGLFRVAIDRGCASSRREFEKFRRDIGVVLCGVLRRTLGSRRPSNCSERIWRVIFLASARIYARTRCALSGPSRERFEASESRARPLEGQLQSALVALHFANTWINKFN